MKIKSREVQMDSMCSYNNKFLTFFNIAKTWSLICTFLKTLLQTPSAILLQVLYKFAMLVQ